LIRFLVRSLQEINMAGEETWVKFGYYQVLKQTLEKPFKELTGEDTLSKAIAAEVARLAADIPSQVATGASS
jgi:hypothetical protein